MCMGALPACQSVRPEESFGFPRTEDTDGCESPCGCWELSRGPRKSSQWSYPLSHLSSPSPSCIKHLSLCWVEVIGFVRILFLVRFCYVNLFIWRENCFIALMFTLWEGMSGLSVIYNFPTITIFMVHSNIIKFLTH